MEEGRKTMNILLNSEGEVFNGKNWTRTPRPRPRNSRLRVIATNNGESMTQQAHLDQTDVNAIVARFDRTGQLPPALRAGQYADVTGLQGDLTERLNYAQDTLTMAEKFANAWTPPTELESVAQGDTSPNATEQ